MAFSLCINAASRRLNSLYPLTPPPPSLPPSLLPSHSNQDNEWIEKARANFFANEDLLRIVDDADVLDILRNPELKLHKVRPPSLPPSILPISLFPCPLIIHLSFLPPSLPPSLSPQASEMGNADPSRLLSSLMGSHIKNHGNVQEVMNGGL